MTKQFVGSRFGQDLPARIAGSTVMLAEATDILPGEPMYQPLIPFYPGGVTSGDSTSTSLTSGDISWERFPSECEISFYQGDDVIVPLYIQDPNNPSSDMSDQNQWEWHAQVRVMHYFRTPLVFNFNVDSTYYPPSPTMPIGKTLVQLFLPRETNRYWGDFEWELYSISPYSYSNFPRPADWPPAETWPPTTGLRTWLYGACKVLPRTSSTDVLPLPSVPYIGPPAVAAVNAGPFVVGPNGRVP